MCTIFDVSPAWLLFGKGSMRGGSCGPGRGRTPAAAVRFWKGNCARNAWNAGKVCAENRALNAENRRLLVENGRLREESARLRLSRPGVPCDAPLPHVGRGEIGQEKGKSWGIRPTVKTLCPTWGRGRVDNGVNVSRPRPLCPAWGRGRMEKGRASCARLSPGSRRWRSRASPEASSDACPCPMRRRKASGKTDEAVFPPKRGRAHEEAGASPRMSGPSTEERQYGTGV